MEETFPNKHSGEGESSICQFIWQDLSTGIKPVPLPLPSHRQIDHDVPHIITIQTTIRIVINHRHCHRHHWLLPADWAFVLRKCCTLWSVDTTNTTNDILLFLGMHIIRFLQFLVDSWQSHQFQCLSLSLSSSIQLITESLYPQRNIHLCSP